MKELQQTVRRLVAKEITLRQTANQAQQEQARLEGEIGEKDRLLSRKDEIMETLLDAQLEAQASSKGLFEELLSSLVNEVMPHIADKVVLTSSISNNRAHLDIDIEVDGELENVAEDQGGSISNVIAMGLRFIVLARHPNRRVLLLDEADCHLREEYIPAFANVMSQLAVRHGVQVLYISHHPATHFVGYGRVLELYREGRATHSRVIAEEPPLPEGVEPPLTAFRYVRLKNFGRLQNAYIELAPGLNVITGDNNLGKSKLMQAITELSTDTPKARRITHKKPGFEVEIGIEEGMSINWSYQRSGSKKRKIELRDEHNEIVHSSDDGKVTPSWLNDYLAMPLVHGQNIHYHSQKSPNYLLADNITSGDRARMLPLGRESRDITQMIKLFDADVDAARKGRTNLLRDLNKQQNMIATMSLIIENPIDLDALQSDCDELISAQARSEHLGELIERIDRLRELEELYLEGLDGLDRIVVVPFQLAATPEREELITRLEHLRKVERALLPILNIQPVPEPPRLHDLQKIAKLGGRLMALRKQEAVLQNVFKMPKPPTFELKDQSKILGLIETFDKLNARLQRGHELIEENAKEKAKIALEWEEMITQTGGICPTCDQRMGDHIHE